MLAPFIVLRSQLDGVCDMTARKDAPGRRRFSVTEAHYHVVLGGGQYVMVRHIHAWRPPTDVIEDEGRLYVIVEIAGMREADFTITLAGQRLIITGSRPVQRHLRSEMRLAFHQLEINYGEFRTEVMLPWAVDEDEVTADYEDGFLMIVLPRQHRHSREGVDE
ncbi:MAG: hypothetical protein Kow00124_27540 [Anaerolineae bacterium]